MGQVGQGGLKERQVPSGHPRSSPTDTFYSKGGALRRLSYTCKDILMEVGAKGLHQPNCGRAFPFSQGCWSYSSRWKQKKKIKFMGIKLIWIATSDLTDPKEWLLFRIMTS